MRRRRVQPGGAETPHRPPSVTVGARPGVSTFVLRQDYLARQLSALFAALRNATERLAEDDPDGAMKEVHKGYTLLPGVDRSLLGYLSVDAIVESLGGDEARGRALARLRATEALVSARGAKDSPEHALRMAHQALLLYQAVGLGGEEADAVVMQRLLGCIDELELAAKSKR